MAQLELLIKKTVILLEKEKILYMLVGGMAANYYGFPRPTFDIDIAFILEKDEKIKKFIAGLKKMGFDIHLEDVVSILQITNRIMVRSSKIPYRIDFWCPKSEYDMVSFKRRIRQNFLNMKVWMISPEDLILSKVMIDRARDEEDIIGIIKREKGRLSWKYIWHWAKALNKYKEIKKIKMDAGT